MPEKNLSGELISLVQVEQEDGTLSKFGGLKAGSGGGDIGYLEIRWEVQPNTRQ